MSGSNSERYERRRVQVQNILSGPKLLPPFTCDEDKEAEIDAYLFLGIAGFMGASKKLPCDPKMGNEILDEVKQLLEQKVLAFGERN